MSTEQTAEEWLTDGKACLHKNVILNTDKGKMALIGKLDCGLCIRQYGDKRVEDELEVILNFARAKHTTNCEVHQSGECTCFEQRVEAAEQNT